jgi:replicative DNA helicase
MIARIPPHSDDLEQAVLGAILLEKSAFELVYEILKPECFYQEANKAIYAVMVSLYTNTLPIELLTVVEALMKSGDISTVGGPVYIAKLTNSVVSAANIENHARLLQEKYMGRELIRLAGETLNKAYDQTTDIFDLITDHERQFSAIQNGTIKSDITGIDTAVLGALTRIEDLRKNESHMTGIPSGFNELDRITHGWQNSDLIIVAARPSVGKTALAINFLRSANVPALFFSMEMGTEQLIRRMLSAESKVFMDSIQSGRVSDGEVKSIYNAAESLAKTNIYFDDTPGLTVNDLKARARRAKRKKNIGIIFIDYMQLMSGESKGQNREQEISTISRNLKALAKELNVPIISLSQLSRKVEERSDKEPQLSDLRESGAIEQDADMVMFIYRPEYYGIDTDENGESTDGLTIVKIAKHRNGSLDTIKLKANLSIQQFTDWTSTYEKPKVNFRPIQLTTNDNPF